MFYNEARKTKLSVPKLANTNFSNQNGNGNGVNSTETNGEVVNINNNKPRRHSKPNELKSNAGEGRSGSAGGVIGSSERVIESLHSTLSSSASLDDLATVSEPIMSSSSSTGGVHKRHEQLKNAPANLEQHQQRRISVSKETSPDDEKKNI